MKGKSALALSDKCSILDPSSILDMQGQMVGKIESWEANGRTERQPDNKGSVPKGRTERQLDDKG